MTICKHLQPQEYLHVLFRLIFTLILFGLLNPAHARATTCPKMWLEQQFTVDQVDTQQPFVLQQGEPTFLKLFSEGLEFNELKITQTSNDFITEVTQPTSMEKNQALYTVYPVKLTPLKSGQLTMPIFTLSDNPTCSTEQKRITVKPFIVSDESELKVTLDKSEIFQGQSVRLYFEWTTSFPIQALKSVNIIIPELLEHDVESYKPWNAPNDKSLKAIGLPINGHRVIAQWRTTAEQKVRIYFSYLIKPKAARKYQFEPSFILASLDKKLTKYTPARFRGMPYPAHFDNNFFEQSEGTPFDDIMRTVTKSQPKTLTVNPLPMPIPKGFTGIIGKPVLNIKLSETELSTNTPLQVNLSVSHPDIEIFPIPDIIKIKAVSDNFTSPSGENIAVIEEGKKVSRQMLYAKSQEINRFPSLQIVYFSPTKQAYETIQTPEISLSVIESEKFNLSTTLAKKGKNIKKAVELDERGIWGSIWDSRITSSYQQKSDQNYFWLAFILIPPVTLFLHQRKQLITLYQDHKRSTPFGLFCYQLNQTPDPYIALVNYFQKTLAIEPSSLSRDQLTTALALQGVDVSHIKALTDYLYQLESVNAGQNSISSLNNHSLISVVKQIDDHLKHHKLSSATAKGQLQ